jgi:DNA-binding CsgD family transcriptional regulator
VTYILLILAAAWLVFYLHNEYAKAPYPYLKAIRNYAVAIVFLFALRLAFFYFGANLAQEMDPESGAFFLRLIQFALSVLMIMMAVLMLLILLSFRNVLPGAGMRILFIIVLLSVSFFFGISIFFPGTESTFLQATSRVFNNSFVFNLVIHNLEFLLVIFFLLFWKKNVKDRERKRISCLFSWVYIFCNSISLGILFLMMQFQMEPIVSWMLKVLVMVLFLLAPYFWVRWVFLPYSQSMLKLINRSGEVQALYMKHNITRREAEVIELILEGKGNQEIKDALFISYHTVKNHLTNIFRKLNVSNRHELVHLFISKQARPKQEENTG